MSKFEYSPVACDKTYRLVIVWKELEHQRGQQKLFDDSPCFFYITNDWDLSALNTDIVNVFLREFSQTLASDEQAVIIWDGAGFHTSKKLLVPENITLVQLPPDSPEPNPLENL